MREIKFRAWAREHNSQQEYSGMYKVTGLAFDSKFIQVHRSSVFAAQTFSLDEVEIMQYTGLKDKNGKEIYEGDIVQASFECPLPAKIRSQIKYKPAYFYTFFLVDDVEVLSEESIYDGSIEVIGNIHENPELL